MSKETPTPQDNQLVMLDKQVVCMRLGISEGIPSLWASTGYSRIINVENQLQLSRTGTPDP